MDRVYKTGAVAVTPDAADNASGPFPTAGNPAGGLPATKPGPYWFHMIAEEIMQVIEAAGIAPNKSTLTQLRDAIPSVAGAARVGQVFLHASSTPPPNAVKANGASLTRASFVTLYNVIGTQHNKTFTASAATDNLTCTAHGFSTGAEVDVAQWDGGVLPAPLVGNTSYWARSVDANTISLHPTEGDATANTNKIDLTTAGSGKLTIALRLSFAVPEVRAEFLRGWDDSRGVDTGRLSGSAQLDDFKAHTHTEQGAFIDGQEQVGTAHVATAQSTNTGSTGGTETRPRNVALLACIAYQ